MHQRHSYRYGLTAGAAALIAAQAAHAGVVATAVTPGDERNMTSYSNSYDPAAGGTDFSSVGDGFKVYQLDLASDENQNAPYAVVDDSADDYEFDSGGIVADGPGGNGEPFFGITDTVNGDTSEPVSATWTFDVTGATTDLQVSFDLAAMGDFEEADTFAFEYAADGGSYQQLFALNFLDTGDETGLSPVTYTLASGAEVIRDDPLTIDGTVLTNDFQTFTSDAIAQPGNTLSFRVTALADGGSEAVAFRHIMVSEVPEPASLALMGLGTLLALKRRRAA